MLILTARADEVDTVVGLDAGADDYVTKPFRLAELLARVRALLRRGTAEVPGTVRGVRVDAEARRAWHGDTELDLTTKEFDLLWILLRDAGKVVTREQIMREVWDAKWWTSTKTLDMHISWLRRKLGDERPPPPVHHHGPRRRLPLRTRRLNDTAAGAVPATGPQGRDPRTLGAAGAVPGLYLPRGPAPR